MTATILANAILSNHVFICARVTVGCNTEPGLACRKCYGNLLSQDCVMVSAQSRSYREPLKRLRKNTCTRTPQPMVWKSCRRVTR